MKRFLAGILAFAMTVSMMTATAFAAPDDGTVVVYADEVNQSNAANNTTGSATIQTDKTGSITIHKYVQDSEVKGWPNKATGEELTTIPSGAHPLNGVEFTVYKIVDKAGLLAYYSGDEELAKSVKIPTQAQLTGGDWVNGNACEKAYYTGKWQLATGWGDPWKNAECIGSLKTGEKKDPDDPNSSKFNDGEVVFEGLELGIYLVIETDSPDVVTAPADPFLVSVPMTINDSWIYDVHAYPKNETTVSGEVKMIKMGKVAGSSNVEEWEQLGGVKFQLQKVNKSTGVWDPVTETVDRNGNTTPLGEKLTLDGVEYKGIITSSDAGVISVSNLSPGNYRFLEISTVDGYILQTIGAWHFEIRDDGKLVWTAEGSENNRYRDLIDERYFETAGKPADYTYTPRPVVGGVPYAINEMPDIEKKVVPKGTPKESTDSAATGYVDDYAADAYKDEANYSVGDKIPYKLTIKVPQYAMQCKTFTVYDTPTNMRDYIDSIEVWGIVYGQNDENGDSSYNLREMSNPVSCVRYGEGGFKIELAGKLSYNEIIITYTAELLDDASVTAISGNPNEATLEYSNGYGWNTPDTATKKITDSTVVYSGEIDVHKKDGADDAPLEGVEFELYELIEDGKLNDKTKLTPLEELAKGLTPVPGSGYVKIEKTPEKTSEGIPDDSDASSRIWATDSDGIIRMRGLSNGTYYLVETKTKDGYNLLQRPVPVVLELGHKTEFEPETQWSVIDGVMTGRKGVVKSRTFTQTVNDGNNLGKPIEVINRKGFDLPATGGMGTFLFTFVGIAMMATAVILFITSKKKESA